MKSKSRLRLYQLACLIFSIIAVAILLNAGKLDYIDDYLGFIAVALILIGSYSFWHLIISLVYKERFIQIWEEKKFSEIFWNLDKYF